MKIQERLIFSFFANIIKGVALFATSVFLARGLQPETYGIYAFLLAISISICLFLDMGTSKAFYTFISKKNQSKYFFVSYFLWVLVQFLIAIFCIYIIVPDSWIDIIWKGNSRELSLLAFIAIFLQTRIWLVISQVGESLRETYKVQSLSVTIAVIHLTLIAVMYWLDVMMLDSIYYLIILEFILATGVSYLILKINFSQSKEVSKGYFKQYWVYCMPLIPYSWLGVLSEFTDKWLLQHYGGSIEQAYYHIAVQFALVSLLATTTIINILWKEVAEANENGDKQKIYQLYDKVIHILYVFSAIVSGFLIPWTSEILLLLFGSAYVDGVIVMSIMLLYPIHQSLGQIVGVMFMALEMTKDYVVINSVILLSGMVFSYLILAPSNAIVPGFGLASTGLALKMVLLQIIGVNLSMWWLAKSNKLPYNFLFQFLGILLFLILGYLVHFLIGSFFLIGFNIVFQILVALIIYCLIAFVLVYFLSNQLLNIGKDDLKRFVKSIYQYVRY
jgi:O-antigen/teichoic acid export membrane protein